MRIILQSAIGESVIAENIPAERICDVLRTASTVYLGKRFRPNYATLRSDAVDSHGVVQCSVFAQCESNARIDK